MKSIKHCIFDFIGINKNTNESSFAFELRGYKYNKKYLYCDSTTYYGYTYRLDRKTGDIFFCDRTKDLWKNQKYTAEYCEKNNMFKYRFTINSDSLKAKNKFIKEQTK